MEYEVGISDERTDECTRKKKRYEKLFLGLDTRKP